MNKRLHDLFLQLNKDRSETWLQMLESSRRLWTMNTHRATYPEMIKYIKFKAGGGKLESKGQSRWGFWANWLTSNDLTTTSLSIFCTLNNSRKIQNLYRSTPDIHCSGNGRPTNVLIGYVRSENPWPDESWLTKSWIHRPQPQTACQLSQTLTTTSPPKELITQRKNKKIEGLVELTRSIWCGPD